MRLLIGAVCISILLSAFSGEIQAKGQMDFTEIDRYAEKEMDIQAVKGISYAIIKDGKVVHKKAFGKSGLQAKMKPDTPVRLGSLSKTITAMAVLQLADRKTVSLDERIGNYLPWFELKDRKAAGQITIRHLLNHTSGISGNDGLLRLAQNKTKTIKDTVRSLQDLELRGEPGKDFEYSNLNYTILGAIIEEVTGKSFKAYIEDNIFAPLEMSHSYLTVQEAQKDGLSKGYGSWFGILSPSYMPYMENAVPSGLMISTAEDLAKLLTVMMNNGESSNGMPILSESAVKEMNKPVGKIDFFENSLYGMGWLSRETNGVRVVGHPGDLDSIARTDMYMIPGKKLGLVVLSNTNTGTFAPGSSHRITEGILALMAGNKPVPGEKDAFNHYYFLFNAAAMCLLVFIFYRFYRIRAWKKTVLKDGRKRAAWIWPVLETSIPGAVLFGIPLITGISWVYIILLQPDMAAVILIFISSFPARGIYKLFHLYRSKLTRTETDYVEGNTDEAIKR